MKEGQSLVDLRERLGRWAVVHRTALINALWLAEEWEISCADCELGCKDIYDPTPDQMRRSDEMKRSAKQYRRMRKFLNRI